MSVCPQCGNSISEQSQFSYCLRCGTQIRTGPSQSDLRRPQPGDDVEYKQPTLPSPSSSGSVTVPATDEGWVHPVVGGCFFLAGPLGWLFLLIRFIRYQGGKRFHTRQWEKVVAGIIGTLLALYWIASLTRAFTGLGSTAYADLRVGDCFDVPAAEAAKVAAGQTAAVTGVQRRTCTTPHHGEVVFTGDAAGTTYPGEAGFDAFFKERCVPAYRSYTGRDFDTDPVYDMTYIFPLAEGWARSADRRVVCFATRVDGKPESRSIRP